MTIPSDLKSYLQKYGRLVDRALQRCLPKPSEKPALIHKAMRYSVTAGGKRLRPLLVIAAAQACGRSYKDVLPTACALELVHTYSLIHDDLPAMDDDDLRRGRPTNHKVFGEDIAILAGDALLTYAFQLVAENAEMKNVRASAVVEVMRILAFGAGTNGMVGGQVADIQADQGRWKNLKGVEFSSPEKRLEFIHLNKTAALIRASLLAGATLAGASLKQRRALDLYGKCIGLAFQIQDDILDKVGDKKKLGKRGSDAKNKKLTYVSLYGLAASRKKAEILIGTAHNALAPFDTKSLSELPPHRHPGTFLGRDPGSLLGENLDPGLRRAGATNIWFGSKVAVLHDLADYVLNRDH